MACMKFHNYLVQYVKLLLQWRNVSLMRTRHSLTNTTHNTQTSQITHEQELPSLAIQVLSCWPAMSACCPICLITLTSLPLLVGLLGVLILHVWPTVNVLYAEFIKYQRVFVVIILFLCSYFRPSGQSRDLTVLMYVNVILLIILCTVDIVQQQGQTLCNTISVPG